MNRALLGSRLLRWILFASIVIRMVDAKDLYAQELKDPGTELSEEEKKALLEALSKDAEDAQDKKPKAAQSRPLAGNFSGVQLDLSFILDVALAWYSDDPEMVGAHDPGDNGFHLQQLELSAGAAVDPFIRFDANLVFSLFGVEIEEAYATSLSLPGNLQVRAGQFLTRFGRINPTHPHTWHFVDQSLIFGKFFGGEGNRGLGAELSWLAPLPWFMEIVGSVNQADGACCARSFLGDDTLPLKTPLEFLYTAALKQFFGLSPDWGLMWGLSAQLGPNASGNGNRTEIYGTDLYLRYRPIDSPDRMSLSLTLEALFRTRQVPFDVLQDFGGYAQLVWQVDPQWEFGARYEFVSGVEDDPLDPDWSDGRQRASIMATYHPSHFSRVRLQAMVDDAPYRTGDRLIYGGILAFELVAGSHGAHTY